MNTNNTTTIMKKALNVVLLKLNHSIPIYYTLSQWIWLDVQIQINKVSNRQTFGIITITEEYPSGWRGRFRKPLEGASLARVRIPVLPPKTIKIPSRLARLFFYKYEVNYSIGLMKKFPYTCFNGVTKIKACSSTFLATLTTFFTSLEETAIQIIVLLWPE